MRVQWPIEDAWLLQRMLVFFRRRKDALYAFRKVLEFPEGKLTWLTYFLLREMFGFLGKNVVWKFFFSIRKSGPEGFSSRGWFKFYCVLIYNILFWWLIYDWFILILIDGKLKNSRIKDILTWLNCFVNHTEQWRILAIPSILRNWSLSEWIPTKLEIRN